MINILKMIMQFPDPVHLHLRKNNFKLPELIKSLLLRTNRINN